MPNSEEQTAKNKTSGDIWLGGVLVVFSLGVLVMSRSIRELGFGDNFDPGSKAFPIGLALLLGTGGLIEIWKAWGDRKALASRASGAGNSGNKSKTVLTLLAGLGVYVFLLPWLGFALTTLLLATGMMIWLGNSWQRSALASIVLITVVYLLFVVGFKVPLPGGVFNLPF